MCTFRKKKVHRASIFGEHLLSKKDQWKLWAMASASNNFLWYYIYEHIFSLILYTISWRFFSDIICMNTYFFWHCTQFLRIFSPIFIQLLRAKKLPMTRVIIPKQANIFLLHWHHETDVRILIELVSMGSSTPQEALDFYSKPYRSCGVCARITSGTHTHYRGTVRSKCGSNEEMDVEDMTPCLLLQTCMKCNQHKRKNC